MEYRLRQMRRNGMDIKEHTGHFHVPEGTRDEALIKKCDEAVKKFITRFEKQGWTLEDRPRVKKVPLAQDKFRSVLDAKGTVVLHIPTDTGLREDHPWYHETEDMWRVFGTFSRMPLQQFVEIADATYNRLLEKGTLPKGLQLVD